MVFFFEVNTCWSFSSLDDWFYIFFIFWLSFLIAQSSAVSLLHLVDLTDGRDLSVVWPDWSELSPVVFLFLATWLHSCVLAHVATITKHFNFNCSAHWGKTEYTSFVPISPLPLQCVGKEGFFAVTQPIAVYHVVLTGGGRGREDVDVDGKLDPSHLARGPSHWWVGGAHPSGSGRWQSLVCQEYRIKVVFPFSRVAEVEGARERRSPKGQGLLRKEGPPTYAILSRNLVLSRFTRFLKGFHRAFN